MILFNYCYYTFTVLQFICQAHYEEAAHYYFFNHINITIAYHPLEDGVNRLVSAKLEPLR